jgi:hypothetical protein
MEKRDILDWQGNKVGELELPVGTSEDRWSKALAFYAKPPQAPTLKPITPRQIRLALLSLGITLDMIDGALSSLPEPQKSAALIEWEYASYFERDNALVAGVAGLLGWGSAELDNLWSMAAQI